MLVIIGATARFCGGSEPWKGKILTTQHQRAFQAERGAEQSLKVKPDPTTSPKTCFKVCDLQLEAFLINPFSSNHLITHPAPSPVTWDPKGLTSSGIPQLTPG